jgi:glutathione S-transferase
MLELYHFEPVSNSAKCLIYLHEKGVEFTSRQLNVDGKSFENYSDWYLNISPTGFVPALVHDGRAIVESTVINEYVEDVFPETPLRPADPYWRARMRIWTKYVDEYLYPALTTIGANFATPFAQKMDKTVVADLLDRIPDDSLRKKWATVTSTGYSEGELADARRKLGVAIGKAEKDLGEHEWLGAPTFSLADIDAFPFIQGCERAIPDALNETASPRVFDWLRRMQARPGVHAALTSYVSRMRPPPPPQAA